MKLLSKARNRLTPATIGALDDVTVMDRGGAVRSIQSADVTLTAAQLDELWNAMHLERLARTYWRFLSKVTLGLIRVHYSDEERAVVLLHRPFVLLRFAPPEYELSADRGIVRWRIRDGILVSAPNEGFLEIDVRRCPSDDPEEGVLHVEVEVANFYPAIAAWFTRFIYTHTQSRVHVLVTHGFLRSLARLELEESAVGRFATPAPASGDNGASAQPQTPRTGEDQTVGETPWPVVGALAAVVAVTGYLVVRALQRR